MLLKDDIVRTPISFWLKQPHKYRRQPCCSGTRHSCSPARVAIEGLSIGEVQREASGTSSTLALITLWDVRELFQNCLSFELQSVYRFHSVICPLRLKNPNKALWSCGNAPRGESNNSQHTCMTCIALYYLSTKRNKMVAFLYRYSTQANKRPFFNQMFLFNIRHIVPLYEQFQSWRDANWIRIEMSDYWSPEAV